MTIQLACSQTGENFASAQIGPLSELDQYEFFPPQAKGKGYPGKLFLQQALGLSAMEVSVNKLPAGHKVPFSHIHHDHEELYVFVRGRGQFQVDGEIIEVREGTVIRVAPPGERSWRNHSQEDLYYLVIQATHGSLRVAGIADGEAISQQVRWPD